MSDRLQNIPFYWTALAHFMACMLYGSFLPMRWDRRRTACVAVLFLLLMSGFMYLTAPQNGALFNLMMGCFAALTGVLLALLCRIDLRQTIYYGTRSFIFGGFMASLPWQLYVYYEARFDILAHPAMQAAFLLVSFALVCAAGAFVELPHRKANAEISLSRLTCFSSLIAGLLIYIISSISFAPIQTPFGGSTYAEAFNLRSIVYFAGVSLLFAVHVQLCETHVVAERDALQSMLSMQYRSYQIEQTTVELINRKYHDLKHQLAVLRSGLGTDQKLEYLDKLEQEIRVYETQYKTGNRILDTILASDGMRCQQEQIELTCVADGSQLDFMDTADISALFGNALDNAIEAVGKIPEREQRLIHLSVNRHKGFLRIRVENRFAGTLKTHGGLLSTTKDDAAFHGYGFKSIVYTAEKYGGSATYTTNDGWFELRILIPIPEEERVGREN